jgi:hypothetical protein
MFEVLEKLPTNVQWLLPLVFSFIGGLVSLIFQPMISSLNKRLELSGRAWERVQDRRLDAYEALLTLSKHLKMTFTTGKHDGGLLETKTVHLETKEAFEHWMAHFIELESVWTDWVDEPTGQHAKYLVDYFQNMKIAIDQIDDNELDELAVRVKQDFVDFSVKTVRIAHDFFSRIDKRRFRIKGNGKYTRQKTHSLLAKTELIKFMIERDLLLKDDKFLM